MKFEILIICLILIKIQYKHNIKLMTYIHMHT